MLKLRVAGLCALPVTVFVDGREGREKQCAVRPWRVAADGAVTVG